MRPKWLLALAAVPLFLPGCGQKSGPKTEKEIVLSSFEGRLLLPDPDYASLAVHAAWLGPDALPPLIRAYPVSVGQKRRRLALLLESLAFHGIRSGEVIAVVKNIGAEKDGEVKQSAMNILFWTGVDRSKIQKYWDPRGNLNVLQHCALPFANCRELLGQLKVQGFLDESGKLIGEPGRTHTGEPAQPGAIDALIQVWRRDKDPGVKLFAALQCYRAGDAFAAEALIEFLKEPPGGWDANPEAGPMRQRALKLLQETTGQTETSYEDWRKWWARNKPKNLPRTPGGNAGQ